MHPPHAPTQLGACFFMDVGLNPAICLHPRALANPRAARTASSAYRSHNSLRVPRLSAATMRYVTACPALRMAARSGERSPTPAGTGSTLRGGIRELVQSWCGTRHPISRYEHCSVYVLESRAANVPPDIPPVCPGWALQGGCSSGAPNVLLTPPKGYRKC